MPESSVEAIIRSMTSGLFNEMLDDILMDITQKAHKDVRRSRSVCDICKTRCRAVHTPQSGSQTAASSSLSGPGAGTSGAATPLQPVPSIVLASTSGSSTPISKSGDIFFDCPNCNRSMASNRFAPHLETCLGLNTNVRRAGARTAAVKTKIGSEGSRSNSPTVVVTDDAPAPPPARKGRPPKNGTPKNSKKKGMPPPTTPELNGNNKRPLSPNPTPPKNNKKQKNAVTSPSPSLKGLPLATSAPGSSVKSTHPKIPSRLRASSTSSFITPSLVASSPGNEESIYSAEGSPSRDGSPDSISPFLTPNSKSKSQKTRPGMPAKGVAGKTPPVTYTPPKPPPAPVTRPDDDVVGMDADDLVETASSEED